jgi:hypothetical protein
MIQLDSSLELTDKKRIPVSVKMKIALSPASTSAPQDKPYQALSGSSGLVVDSENRVQQAKAVGGVVYEGLKTVVDVLYECSDAFPPLKTAAAIFQKITKFVEVCALMCDIDPWVIRYSLLPIRLYRTISRNSKTSKGG